MWVWSLGWEDPLEEGMTSHSNILAWRIPWTEEPDGLQSIGSRRVRCDWSNVARMQHNFITYRISFPRFLFKKPSIIFYVHISLFLIFPIHKIISFNNFLFPYISICHTFSFPKTYFILITSLIIPRTFNHIY